MRRARRDVSQRGTGLEESGTCWAARQGLRGASVVGAVSRDRAADLRQRLALTASFLLCS